MSRMSPAQRTLRALREQGRKCAVTEHWNPHGGVRQDLFGFIDIIALDIDGIVAVQSTDGAHFAAHVTAILDGPATENVIDWLASGGRVEVWGWRQLQAKRSGKARRWAPRVRVIQEADFARRKGPIAAFTVPPGPDYKPRRMLKTEVE